ncbi:hypothetical protein HRG84_19395 [Flavisolibacter sp. BT320]|nr:hypothetical protein [Flavisolibacter longurius]
MKVFLSILILLLFQAIFTSCNRAKNNTYQARKVDFFDPIALGATSKTDNLLIEARFSECGEWSGHKEKIIVYADSTGNIHALYQLFPYNCDSLQYYYGNEDISPIIEKDQIVGDREKQAISEYIQGLTQAKMTERPIDRASHSAKVFSLKTADSTFLIRLVTNKESDEKHYKGLVSELFGSTTANTTLPK